ncbi:MAG: hypothetical protein ACI857_000957 [Arenicella sp.]|jgi:hypothetical protein
MIETKSAYISKLDEDTIKVVFKPNAYLTSVEYAELYGHYCELLQKKEEMKFLVIVQEGFKVENRYMKFFKKEYRTDFKKAEAYVILNPSSRMFFKVGVQLIPHSYETKMFDKEEEAIKWLKQIK